MPSALLLAALVMGLTGGPHCAVMCGAACAGIARTGPAMALFQLGRILGYAVLGGVAAGSLQGLGWLAGATAAARPLWTLLHLAALLFGLTLLLQGRQPLWVDSLGRSAWSRVRRFTPAGLAPRGAHAPLLAGALWAFMPCGLLYSALLLAALAGSAPGGAGVMAAFAAGSAVSLTLGPWLWRHWRQKFSTSWGTRLAGSALVAVSAWALWLVATSQGLPWCVDP
ncbi:MAG TPA: sulfite exporter TauE/SafE family protein [Burkholderiaceae bacterium]|nr:sulfite exporter TauE/SafE family protein [Burkholderiaceae bacterium]